ncbi:hypothetical protein BKA62DRAFT_684269 [Auriculariales sp. MPI-PUGE-AT-0066]|nr:hypothetical protein BKA62DRAFT_684269 [Auriculariales sp. MPI-PUGE-AT-0066]
MDVVSKGIDGLFTEPPASALETVLVSIGALLRDDPARLSEVEDALTRAHRDVHLDLQSHQNALIAILSLPEMQNHAKVVDTWTHLALKPLLKDTRVESTTLTKAKELAISVLVDPDIAQHVIQYRKHILQLYLMDAPSDMQSDDALDMAQLEDSERDSKRFFKDNLADIIIKFALQSPQEFCGAVNRAFDLPQSRLELLVLLRSVVAHDDFDFPAFLQSDLFSKILLSLSVDKSAFVMTLGVSVLVMSLPYFAVRAPNDLAARLPELLVMLARVLASNALQRPPAHEILSKGLVESGDPDDEGIMDDGGSPELSRHIQCSDLEVRPELQWSRLERTPLPLSSGLSSADHLFGYLYGLFPCNTVIFIRHPFQYIEDHQISCPFVVGWEKTIDEGQMRSRAMLLSRTLALSPWALMYDRDAELRDHSRWNGMQPCDVSTNESALPAQPLAAISSESASLHQGELSINSSQGSGRSRVSVRDMIATTIALKAGGNIEVLDAPSHWVPDSALIQAVDADSPPPSAPSTDSVDIPVMITSFREKALEAVGILQRECVLLRNALNYQLVINRLLLQNVSKLQQERSATSRRDVELQQLRKERKVRRTEIDKLTKQLNAEQLRVAQLQRNLTTEAADHVKARKDARAREKKWDEETNELRVARDQLDQSLAAHSVRLRDVTKQLFAEETKLKESQHKIDRLAQFEEQIERQKQQLQAWDRDVQLYKAQKLRIEDMVSGYEVMRERLKTYQGNNEALARENRDLETRLAQQERASRTVNHVVDPSRAALAHLQQNFIELQTELLQLKESYKRLRTHNQALRAKNEEYSAQMNLNNTPADDNVNNVTTTAESEA